jgi:oligopeptide transport system substrate-binding protein
MAKLERLLAHGDTAGGALSESGMVEQCAGLLTAVAERQPLLLLFDDLQWADSASMNLLNYLDRSLRGNRVLIIGAFRPEYVALGRDGDKHPLERVVAETKRLAGDAVLDLAQEESGEKRAFVDDLLDSEANTLDAVFRQALLAHTGGQPLFTVEVLRYLQDRGDLVLDEDGAWTAGPALAWDVLPDRVEGVIEARISRLDDDLRQVLNVAAVEGENFTAQVIARVLAIDERSLLRTLSNQLEKKHQLVRERSPVQLGWHLLSRFRFGHALFQQYLYDDLSPSERLLFHGEIAATLEELTEGQTDEIAVLLARHFDESGEATKAVKYLLVAGDRARTLYAHQEAIDSYERAVEILEEQGDSAEAAKVSIKLGLTYHNEFRFTKSRQAYEKGFRIARRAATQGTQALMSPAPHSLRLLVPEPASLDPTFIEFGNTNYIIDQLFSGLVELTPDLDIVPDVARSWQVLDGGRRYLFNLRQDVTWSDGIPVTAADFEFAWKRALAPALEAPEVEPLFDIKGAQAYNQGDTQDSSTVGVRAIGDWTLEVEVEQPAGHFLYILTYPHTKPVPRHTVTTHGAEWAAVDKIVTNGPFRLVCWEQGQTLQLKRYADYHGRFSGNLEQITLRFDPKPDASIRLYKEDQLDSIQLNLLSSSAVQELRQNQPAEYFEAPMFQTEYLAFNHRVPPFDNLQVRQAIAHAIERKDLVDMAYGGQVTPANGGFVSPGMPGHTEGIGLAFDPDKARQLLAEAGYPSGSGFPVTELFLITEEPLNQTGYLQEHLLDVLGIEVELHALSFFEMPDRMRSNPPRMWLAGWIANYPDPYDFLGPRSWKGESGWKDEAYEQLIQEASGLIDQRQRLQFYRQADKILIEQAAIVPLVYDRYRHMLKPWVRRYPVSGMKDYYWKDVIIDPH